MAVKNTIDFNFSIVKVNKEYKNLTGAEFKITSLDGTYLPISNIYFPDYGVTHFCTLCTFGDENLNVYDYIPDNLLSALNNLKNYDDVSNFAKQYGFDYDGSVLYFYVPFILKETEAPLGYKKHDYIIYAHASVKPRLCSDSLMHYFDWLLSYYNDTDYILSSNTNIDFTNLSNFSSNSEVFNSKEEQKEYCGKVLNTTSTNVFEGTPVDEDECSLVNYIIDEEGEVKLDITSTVNDVTSYIIKTKEKLKYKINVFNSGDILSSNNIITANLPTEIIIDESSISDQGIYNSSNNTIIWKLKELDVGDTYEFTFDANLKDGADTTKDYIVSASIYSYEQNNPTTSNDTIVTLRNMVETVENPKTGIGTTTIPFINMEVSNITLVISLTIFLILLFYKINKKNKLFK